jgi:periplasmic protein TonB
MKKHTFLSSTLIFTVLLVTGACGSEAPEQSEIPPVTTPPKTGISTHPAQLLEDSTSHQTENPNKKRALKLIPPPVIPSDLIDPIEPYPGYEIKEPQSIIEEITQTDDEIVQFVEQPAEFPGGMSQLADYIKTTMQYPPDAKENNIQGRVYLRFVVLKDGTIRDIKVVKRIYPSIDKEAIRLIKGMPIWIPGKNQGKIVNSQFTLPILFKLE